MRLLRALPYVLTFGILAYGAGGGSFGLSRIWQNGGGDDAQLGTVEQPISSAEVVGAEALAPSDILQELEEASGQVRQLNAAYGVMEQMFDESQTELARLELELSEMSHGRVCYEQLRDRASDYTVFFEPSSTTLGSEEVHKIVNLGAKLRDCPNVLVHVTGHSDSVGDDTFNILLSWQRADTVVSIMDAVGIDIQNVESLGFGARAPMAEGDVDDDLDRRVEFHILPNH